METINVQYFYGLGLSVGQVRILAASGEQLSNPPWRSALASATEWVNSFATGNLDTLPKTKKAATVLVKALDDFSKLLGQHRETSTEEGGSISDALTAFYNVFEQEVLDIHCYMVTPVGAYEVSALLKNASSHLSEMAQKVVTSEIREDFNKAGECLALDLYTACGFHAMRAVEAEARRYHEGVTGVYLADVPLGTLIYGDPKNSPSSGLNTRHKQEGNLHGDPLGLIISLLSQINAIYRRPIMHPNMSLNAPKAKFVFDMAALVISAMVTDLFDRFVKKRRKKKKRKTK